MKYETPEMEIIYMDKCDVIITSRDDDDGVDYGQHKES